jgi:hypothetical protein
MTWCKILYLSVSITKHKYVIYVDTYVGFETVNVFALIINIIFKNVIA